MTRGPEERNIIGRITEEQAITFFEGFCKWKLILKNEDFGDTKFGKDKSGFDQLYQVNDPILNEKIYVMVESKFRENTAAIRSETLRDFVYTLKKKLLKGQNPNSWKKTVKEDIKKLKYGILFLRFENYSDENIKNTLSSISLSETKRESSIPPTIFTLFNYRLAKFAEFASNKDISFIYPAGLGQKDFKDSSDVLSLFYLFSDIIIGKIKEKTQSRHFVISFEPPSLESTKYICLIISRLLQLKKGDDCTIYFSEGNFNEINKYKSDFLEPEYKHIGINILGGDLSCNFDFKEKFK